MPSLSYRGSRETRQSRQCEAAKLKLSHRSVEIGHRASISIAGSLIRRGPAPEGSAGLIFNASIAASVRKAVPEAMEHQPRFIKADTHLEPAKPFREAVRIALLGSRQQIIEEASFTALPVNKVEEAGVDQRGMKRH